MAPNAGVPWGISESAFNARDIDLRYQYSAFGVPGLGLKRGLSEDVVIAPYATALAAMVDPVAAVAKYRRGSMEGGRKGSYGLYEALDYTAARVPEGQKVAVVQAYFAHHQGMTLVALANVLTGGAMRFAVSRRTHRESGRTASAGKDAARRSGGAASRGRSHRPPRACANLFRRRCARFHDAARYLVPRTQLLSNGRYAVMLTSAGSGLQPLARHCRHALARRCHARLLGLAISICAIRRTNEVWSAGYQPCGVEPDTYEASFFEDRAEIIRRDALAHNHSGSGGLLRR